MLAWVLFSSFFSVDNLTWHCRIKKNAIFPREKTSWTKLFALASAPFVWFIIILFCFAATRATVLQCAVRSVRTMTLSVHHVVRRRRVDAATAAVLPKTMVAPMSLLLLLVFSLSSFSSAAAECPAKCMCFKTTVRCMFLHLDRIPDRISPTTTVL